MRWTRGLLAAVVLVLGLPALAGAERGREVAEDPTLAGTQGPGGTGILPSFREHGANLIRLQVGAFDPLSDHAPTQPGVPTLRVDSLQPGDVQYWLVQVRGERFAETRTAIEGAGGIITGTLPDDTYIVRATLAQREVFQTSDAVRWSGLFQPSWRIPAAAGGRPGLLELDGTRTFRVYLFPDEPLLGATKAAISALPGIEVRSQGVAIVDVRTTADRLGAIASIPGVEWLGVPPRIVSHNYNARWVTDTGVRDLFAATAPNGVVPTRLNGAGQTAAVADTGLNYTYDLNGRAHIAFRDCNPDGSDCEEAKYMQVAPGSTVADLENVTVANAGGHRKMVAYFDLGDTGPNMYDESSHGSHTAGSVDGDQPPYGQYNGDDGIAPAANHVHQNLADEGGGLNIPGGLLAPEELYYLFAQAYRPRAPGDVPDSSGATGNPDDYSTDYIPTEDARTHNNSWGAIYPVVDEGHAHAVDEFVWDHEDMAIVFSAGNEGPSVGTTQSPTVAKNDLTSGASANGRQPMVSIDSMASFSSHGPSGDGRYSVDLATPGQIVVSVKGGSVDEYHVAQGTSMSAPILTGLATLVRQYFYDGYAAPGGDGFANGAADGDDSRLHNPSAALVKAALVNGAERMRGFYTGDEGTVRGLDGQWPSAGQGFGRVNLGNSLYFTNDSTNNWYIDVYRGDTAGNDANCLAAGGSNDDQCTAFTSSPTPQTRTFQMDVDEGQPLDVTLNWTDAPSALPAGTPALVNDLNLTVTGPGGATYVGNNMNTRANPAAVEETTTNAPGPLDTRNPTERVRVAAPAAGTYTITVTTAGIAVPNQGFALAGSGLIQPVSGGFTPGPAPQIDQAGAPEIVDGSIDIRPHTADTALLTFETNEPTTAVAETTIVGGATETFQDSYNEGATGFPGDGTQADLGEGPVETSSEYADKLVVGTHHEILFTGLAGGPHPVQVTIEDLASNQVGESINLITPASTFGAKSDDTQYCIEGEQDCHRDSEPAATQLYAGDSAGSGYLGAWMFRVPENAIDPSQITGAVVETYSGHDWVPRYTDDPVLNVDLLDESVEPDWQTQSYDTIHEAPADALALPERTDKEGAYQRYAFTFQCGDLEALRGTLADVQDGERLAAFRYEASPATDALFSMEFGFNRRSRGPSFRPRLILLTGGQPYDAVGACDPGAPAPTISEVGVHAGLQSASATVSWETDVPANSIVFYRESGATDWTQVGTPALTTKHAVEVLGVDPTKEYEFFVRSVGCNGEITDDTNSGDGYDFFYPPLTAVTRWFTGEQSDQANKVAEMPTATWTDAAPTGEPPIVQQTQGGANPDAAQNSLAIYWTGEVPADPSGPDIPAGSTMNLDWFFSSAFGNAFLTTAELTIFSGDPLTKVHQQEMGLSANAPDPVRNFHSINLQGDVEGQMVIQLTTPFINNDFQAHYGAASTPGLWTVPLTGGPPASVPSSGPIPPPSAEGNLTDLPETRTTPLPRDIAAGTGLCGAAGLPDVTITDPDEGDEVAAANLLVRGTADYGGGTPQVLVHATAPGYDSGNVNAQTTNGFQDWDALIDLSGQEGKQVQIVSRLMLDGSQVDVDQVTVTVGEGEGGGDGPNCPGYGGDPSNQIVGTPRDDVLTGTKGRDIICGQGGDDSIRGLAGDDILLGGDGNDRVRGDQDGDLVLGQGGNDTLGGGKGPDDIRGGGGDDDLRGRKSNDNIRGNQGADNLRGGGGRDFLRGNGGDDTLAGGGDRDSLRGGGGNDDCDGGRGTNSIKSCEGRGRS